MLAYSRTIKNDNTLNNLKLFVNQVKTNVIIDYKKA